MAIFGNKDKNGNFTINFMSVKDTILQRDLDFQLAISATLLEDRIEFKERLSKLPPTYLMYDQITKAEVVSTTEIEKIKKSSLGRAAVGGILLGPLGAVVGAIDGTGKKVKKQLKLFFVFNYKSSDGEDKSLPVEICGATLGLEKFKKALIEKCPQLVEEKNDKPKFL